jgi:RNA polymerase sigma-70 factor (ECF subfamily)
MTDGHTSSSKLLECLARAARGEIAALNEVILTAGKRLELLTHRMLRDYPRVRRWAETGDVLQNALIRLCRALAQVQPATPRDFYALATTQIRRELIDLARHFAGRENAAAHHESDPAGADEVGSGRDTPDQTHDPAALADWAEFHSQVSTLPDEDREVFGLLFYQGLAQEEAAELLGVSLRTIQRRWQAALLHLHRARNGEPPGT